jgi:hypothetical protein
MLSRLLRPYVTRAPRRSMSTILEGTKDVFKGLTIDVTKAPQTVLQDPVKFHNALQQTLENHKSLETRGVWMRIPRDHSKLIPVAVDLGFEFHHAEPQYVMMTHWLPTKEQNHLPRAPQHYVGCGGAVVDIEKREILLITERTEYFPGDPNVDYWKIAGGSLDNPDVRISYYCVLKLIGNNSRMFRKRSIRRNRC